MIKCQEVSCAYSGLKVVSNHIHHPKQVEVICENKNCDSHREFIKVWVDSHVCYSRCMNKNCIGYKIRDLTNHECTN